MTISINNRRRHGFWFRLYPRLLCICLTVAAGTATADRGWEIETVDAPRKFSYMTDRSLCIDGQGQPHIAFGEDHVHHAWLDDGTWIVETVDPSPGVGEDASMTIDLDGGIHIAYYDRINDALKYAFGDGTGWQTETVDIEGGRFTSVAVDEFGMPHVVYKAEDLNYAVKTADGWVIQIVETVISPGLFSSLALDAAGFAHISHRESFDALMYTCEDSAGWHTEEVDADYSAGWYSSIAVDGAGLPHISYYDRGNRTIAYAVRETSGWQIEDLGRMGDWTSLAIGGDGIPHMVFCDGDEAVYAFRDGSEWVFESIDADAMYASIAIDASGNPSFSFMCEDYFERIEELRYASKPEGIWEVETVTPAGDVGTYAALARGDADQLHVCYVNSANSHIRYAVSGSGGWSLTELDETGTNLGLALDLQGYPHIGYLDEDANTVNYLFMDAQGWHVETVEEDISFDAYTSITVDAIGLPHIAYRDSRILRYATKSDTGWVIEVLGYEGQQTSIVVDVDNRPHIGYHSYGDRMGYAYRDESGWQFESADMAGEGGMYNSLVLDDNGYPHLTYFDNLPDDIRYAYKDASGWHVETVDEEWDVGKYTSLALDSNGNPRVSYYYGMDVDLRFGYRDDDVWHTYTLASEGGVGAWSQLVLDSADLPHVVYYNESTGDLMYAHSDAVSAPTACSLSVLPGSVHLMNIYPMPIHSGASITYRLGPGASDSPRSVSLRLYDGAGRLISSSGFRQSPGMYTVPLSIPSTAQGGPAAGIYYLQARVENPPGRDVKTIVVVR